MDLTVIKENGLVINDQTKHVFIEAFNNPTGDGLEELIKMAEMELAAFEFDLDTPKGRKEIASFSRKFATSKRVVDDMGKELVAGIKEQAKVIDKNRKVFRDKMDELRDKARQPLNEWEKAEEERKARFTGIISEIQAFDRYWRSEQLKAHLEKINAFDINESFQEFELEAADAKKKAIEELAILIERAEESEAQQRRIAELEAKQKAQEQKEREANMIREAEERAAQREKEAAIEQAKKAEREAQAERQRLEQEKQDAIERAERAESEAAEKAEREKAEFLAEQQRQADLKDKEERKKAEEEERRKANKAHQTRIMTAVKHEIINLGVDSETARVIVLAMAKGEISNVSINF